MIEPSGDDVIAGRLSDAWGRKQPLGYNPYRMPRPAKRLIVTKRRFYTANVNGKYTGKATLWFALTREYLWVHSNLSIPLSSITETGLTKKGGFIYYWDELAKSHCSLFFTSIRWMVHKRSEVEDFLKVLDRCVGSVQRRIYAQQQFSRDTQQQFSMETVEPLDHETISCEYCQSIEIRSYVFPELSFFGFLPGPCVYKLKQHRFALCEEHAKEKAMSIARGTALKGYWGFPGFLAAPWYVVRCILELRRNQVNDGLVTTVILIQGIGLPIAVMAALIAWIIKAAK